MKLEISKISVSLLLLLPFFHKHNGVVSAINPSLKYLPLPRPANYSFLPLLLVPFRSRDKREIPGFSQGITVTLSLFASAVLTSKCQTIHTFNNGQVQWL